MKTGKLAMTGAMVLALALGVMPVQGKEVKTDTAPEMYRTVQEMGQALASYPAVKSWRWIRINRRRRKGRM